MNKKKILTYTIGPIGTGLVGFISLPIITWFFSVEDVGRISMLQVFTSFFVLLFSLGLDQAYVREYHLTNNKPQLFRTLAIPSLTIGIIFCLAFFISNPTFIAMYLYDIPNATLSMITILCFILSLSSRFLSLVLRMQERAFAFSMSQLLPKLFFLIFILTIVWLGYRKNIYSLAYANLLSITVAFFVFLWNTRAEWYLALKTKIDFEVQKKALSFGLPLIVAGMAMWGLNVMDRLFLKNMSSLSELGIYSVAMSIAAVATLFTTVFNTIWAPMIYKWESEGQIDQSKINQITHYALATVYFLIVLSALFSWLIPYFLPKNYNSIQYIITACLMVPFFYMLSEITGLGIALKRKTKFSVVVAVVAMVVNCILNYIFVPKFGASGAATSNIIAFLIFFILRTEFSRLIWRKFPVKKIYLVLLILVAGSIMNIFLMNEYIWQVIFIWFVILLLGCLIFKDLLLKIYRKFKYSFSAK